MNSLIRKVIALIFVLQVFNVQAQLKVGTNGFVSVGMFNPHQALTVNGNAVISNTGGYPVSAAYIRGNNGLSGPGNPEYTWYNNDLTGFYHPGPDMIGLTTGGVQRMLFFPPSNAFVFAAYGSILSSGHFVFSDKRFKKNICNIERACDKLNKLEGKQYEHVSDSNYKFTQGLTYGFIAQDIQKEMPEVVLADTNGALAVNYIAIIPLLTEAIKEQQAQINELKIALAQKNKNDEDVFGNKEGTKKYRIEATYPNPFDSETSLSLWLAKDVKSASIVISDFNGNKKFSIEIKDKGDVKVPINLNGLIKGIYYYTLIIDGQAKETNPLYYF